MCIPMENQALFETQEKIIRKVTASGNGAHIFAPKEWLDEEVMVVRISRLDIKKEILRALEPHMENIVSVILFGSYARGEQNENSDVDVLVVSNKPFKVQKKGFDIIVIEKNKLERAIKINPILIYSAIKEGTPLVNSMFFNELRKKKINFSSFREYIKSTEDSLKSSIGILELDDLEDKNIASNSAVYSLFLRLRGIFIVDSLIKKIPYSNKLFKGWLKKKIPELDYEDFYLVYIAIRDNKASSVRINLKIARLLASLLKKEIKKIS